MRSPVEVRERFPGVRKIEGGYIDHVFMGLSDPVSPGREVDFFERDFLAFSVVSSTFRVAGRPDKPPGCLKRVRPAPVHPSNAYSMVFGDRTSPARDFEFSSRFWLIFTIRIVFS